LEPKNHDALVRQDKAVHFWTIEILVQAKTFEELAEEYDIRREKDRWLVGEGAFEQPANEIRGSNWWGLRMDHFRIRSSNLSDTGSFESEAVWIELLSTASKRTANVKAGFGADAGPLALILRTIRFDPSP